MKEYIMYDTNLNQKNNEKIIKRQVILDSTADNEGLSVPRRHALGAWRRDRQLPSLGRSAEGHFIRTTFLFSRARIFMLYFCPL